LRLKRIAPLDPVENFFLGLLPDPARLAAPGGLAATPGPGPLSPALPADRSPRFWDRLLSLADSHRLAGYFYSRHHRQRWWRECPPPVQEALREWHVQTSFRNEFFTRDLKKVLPRLAEAGVVPILLKGPALNLTVFDDPGERSYADIDLLIRPAELETVHRILRDLGYQVDETTQSEAFYRRHHFHLIFRRPDRPWCCFEIHWDLAIPLMDTRLQADELRRRATTTSLAGCPVRLLAPEDLLLHLCLHTSLSAFSVLAQIRDIHAVLVHPGWRIGPEVFWDRAQRYRILNPAAACLELARLFGPVPALTEVTAARPPWRAGAAVLSLLRPQTVLRQRLRSSAAGGRAISLRRRDRWLDHLVYLGRQILPSPADLGLNGHPLAAGAQTRKRRFSLAGLLVSLRTVVYLLLARLGWEVEPVFRNRGPLVPGSEPNRG